MMNKNNNLYIKDQDNDGAGQQQQIDNEILFWKVFHNKYIRHCIMNQIETTELDGKRMKFKDTTSLLDLVKNEEHQLLKFKLEAGEHIELCKESLSLLFKSIIMIEKDYYGDDVYLEYIEYFKRKGEYRKGDEYLDNDFNNEINSSNSRQSFNLLLKYKSKELLKYNLIKLVFHACLEDAYVFKESTIELIDQLISNGQYNDGINNSKTIIKSNLIERVICRCPSPILDRLLKQLKKTNTFDSIVTREFKNNSLSWAEYSEEMIEYLLKDHQLFNIPPQLPKKPLPANKRFKSSMFEEISISTHNEDGNDVIKYDSDVVKLDQRILFENIKSQATQYKLIQLNYIKYDQPTGLYKEKILAKEFEKQLSTLLLNKNDCSKHNVEEILKNIFQILSKLSYDIYNEYLSKYDEPIDGIYIETTLGYSLGKKSINGLKYLLSLEKDELAKINRNRLSVGYPTNPQIKPEFVKLYTTGYKYFSYSLCDEEIVDYIYSIRSNQEEYQSLLNSIVRTYENKNFTDLLFWKWWNSFDIKQIKGSKRFIIQDTDTIDTIFNHFDQFKLLHKTKNKKIVTGGGKIIFKFESWQLIDYAKSKYGLLFFNDDYNVRFIGTEVHPSYYLYPFTRAINNCDIESLKYIDQLLGGKNINQFIGKFEGCKSIYKSRYSKTILKKIKELKEMKGYSDKIKINFNHQHIENNDKIIKLIEYLNSSGYKLFSSTLFKKFVSDISKLELSNNLKINFQQFQSESLELILDSISKSIDPYTIKLVLNNINPFTVSNLDSIVNEWEKTLNGLLDTSYFIFDSEYDTEDEEIGNGKNMNYTHSTLFYLLGSDENYTNTHDCYSRESSNDIISCISLILGHFENNYNQTSTLSTRKKNKICDTIEKVVNYLFKRLIKVYQVDINRVKRIYQFIKSNWLSITRMEFQFQHSLYHIVYYLSIRSLKFTDHICSLNINLRINQFDRKAFDNVNFNYEDPNYFDKPNSNVPQFQLLKSFSYDHIFNTPLQELIDQLKQIDEKIYIMDNNEEEEEQ